MKKRNKMNEYLSDEKRIYAPIEGVESVNDGYPQLSAADTGWTENEREQMYIHGFDGMDTLRAWLD